MNKKTWYWLNGTPYCPACVECDTPALDVNDPDVRRTQEGGVAVPGVRYSTTRCACCHAGAGVYAKHEQRKDEGTGWFVYEDGEDKGGPFETESDALDAYVTLCDASPEQWHRFEVLAHEAGHASAKSTANENDLWAMTVQDALAWLQQQANA